MPHGDPVAALRHICDFGNIEANASGVAKFTRVDHVIKLDGPTSVIGHAVIVHAKADDLKSQPAGNAGARVACGVIGAKK
jgi:Cu-Zn family superoxide dismutase